MKSAEIRELFLTFFEKRGHKVVPSSSLVPHNDPTLLFTNAGMVQFKEVFLGAEQLPYKRATTSQRCVRAGGKHNDLENVGYTARHHTFFEMLGNFSFGDYSKRQAIEFAWEFLTEVLLLPKEKLWVTVYNEDQEAEDIWLNEIGASKERFSRCGEKDNFWSMGDSGPCGPCSEIFFDHGDTIPGGPPGSPDEEGDRYVEIWNLVFMQYNRDKAGKLTPLPKPSVDTGMGLERIAAVQQGVQNNYDIDVFQTLINQTFSMTKGQDKNNASFKVIADHIRSCAFMIIDGVLPGNEGRGYVLRRIIRRAARHGHKLGLDNPFFYKLASPLVDEMGDAYPDLKKLQAHIEKILHLEEEQFLRTLSHGLSLLEADMVEAKNKKIKGEVAFKLYDTYGFPLDLTADIAREKGFVVDKAGFDLLMEKQKKQSKASMAFKVSHATSISIDEKSEFVGYEKEQANTALSMILSSEGESLSTLKASKETVSLVLKASPFYAESGGQIGDTGVLLGKNTHFKVLDTQKQNDAILHIGQLVEGELKLGETLDAQVDSKRRDAIRLNHSATHLLHAALKKVLGAHVQQKGSLVTADKARFDFSHYQAMTLEEQHDVESLLNQQVRKNHLIMTQEMDFDEAKESGACALFGEKYSDKVRVLSMGDFSKELCGGTHAARTGDIGFCKILSEAGIASGVRRVEFITGEAAQSWVTDQDIRMNALGKLLHAQPDNLEAKVKSLVQDLKLSEKEKEQIKGKLAQKSGQSLLDKVQKIGEYSLLIARLDNLPPKDLRVMLDKVKDNLTKAIIVLVAVNDNKMNVVAGITKDGLDNAPSAKTLVQAICGKGGGRDDMAQGGGILVPDLDARFDEVKKIVTEKVS
jgi:alanyl-tRNA synthetase